jgi:F0F1-type ATP synthase membrane subunit b/b'
MDKTPKKDTGGPQPEKMEDKQPKIMTKPLPEILDELEDYIKRVEEAVKQAQAAARESREAAAQAKLSGEKAAEAAKKAADAAVARVREEAARAIEALGTKFEREMSALEERATQEAQALDRAFLALKEKHIKDSPFLGK